MRPGSARSSRPGAASQRRPPVSPPNSSRAPARSAAPAVRPGTTWTKALPRRRDLHQGPRHHHPGKAAALSGWNDGDGVAETFSRDFTSNRDFIARTGGLSRIKNDAMVRKAFTATNQGLSGVPYGLVPFDLLAPSPLIYPVYTLFRNKFPRPAGQGASRQVYGLLGISGSQTGGQNVLDISIPELVQTLQQLDPSGSGQLAHQPPSDWQAD